MNLIIFNGTKSMVAIIGSPTLQEIVADVNGSSRPSKNNLHFCLTPLDIYYVPILTLGGVITGVAPLIVTLDRGSLPLVACLAKVVCEPGALLLMVLIC